MPSKPVLILISIIPFALRLQLISKNFLHIIKTTSRDFLLNVKEAEGKIPSIFVLKNRHRNLKKVSCNLNYDLLNYDAVRNIF